MKKVLGISLLAIFAVLFYSAFLYKEKSPIASRIRLQSEPTFAVSKVVDGNWDFVCMLVELMNPNEVAKNLIGSDAKFLGSGNAKRNILLDGESGLLVAKMGSREYAIFLAFDHDKISFDPPNSIKDADRCLKYSSARLSILEINDGPDWKSFALEEE